MGISRSDTSSADMPWVLAEYGSRVCLGWGSWTDGEGLGAMDKSTQFCPGFYTCHLWATPLVPMTTSQAWSRQHLELNWSDPIFCGTWTCLLDSDLELCAHAILISWAFSLPMLETRAQSPKNCWVFSWLTAWCVLILNLELVSSMWIRMMVILGTPTLWISQSPLLTS